MGPLLTGSVTACVRTSVAQVFSELVALLVGRPVVLYGGEATEVPRYIPAHDLPDLAMLFPNVSHEREPIRILFCQYHFQSLQVEQVYIHIYSTARALSSSLILSRLFAALKFR
jgi:hypothetical protein